MLHNLEQWNHRKEGKRITDQIDVKDELSWIKGGIRPEIAHMAPIEFHEDGDPQENQIKEAQKPRSSQDRVEEGVVSKPIGYWSEEQKTPDCEK